MTDTETLVIVRCPACLTSLTRVQLGEHVSPVRCHECGLVQKCYYCARRSHPRSDECYMFGRPRKANRPLPSARVIR